VIRGVGIIKPHWVVVVDHDPRARVQLHRTVEPSSGNALRLPYSYTEALSMRITGRVVRPSTLAERRILKGLGVDSLRVPRNMNPFAVARYLRRLALGVSPEARLIRQLAESNRARALIQTRVDVDRTEETPVAESVRAAS
jgi:hypothetical protein